MAAVGKWLQFKPELAEVFDSSSESEPERGESDSAIDIDFKCFDREEIRAETGGGMPVQSDVPQTLCEADCVVHW